MVLDRIVAFLARPEARPTHVYERAVVLFVEALCLLAVVLVVPAGVPTYLLLVRAPFQLRKAASDHAARSGAARRREHEEAMGRDPVKLSCARDLEWEALAGQAVTAAMPLVDLGFVLALAGLGDAAVVASVAAATTLIRLGMVEFYGAWRRAYRARRPLVVATEEQRYQEALAAGARWLVAGGWPCDLEKPEPAIARALKRVFVDCPGCGGGGMSGAGGGYDDVCSTCGGQSAGCWRER
jgi:hypothetical protein